MKYDVIIVGAGASGMMAAITAASHHKKVLLLERMDKLGKKILANHRLQIYHTLRLAQT